MPLLISSRMMSAGLTASSSASSLTVIVPGSSIGPRSTGSTTWTAPCGNAPVRRCGFWGPRRPVRTLLLLATRSSLMVSIDARGRRRNAGVGGGDGEGVGSGREAGRDVRGDGRLQRVLEGALPGRRAPAERVTAEVGTAPGRPAGGVDRNRAVGRAHDPNQLDLG